MRRGRQQRREPGGTALSWPRAVLTSLAVVLLLALIFAVVPDRIADALERRDVSSDARDLAILAWWLAAIVAVPWALSRLQRRGEL